MWSHTRAVPQHDDAAIFAAITADPTFGSNFESLYPSGADDEITFEFSAAVTDVAALDAFIDSIPARLAVEAAIEHVERIRDAIVLDAFPYTLDGVKYWIHCDLIGRTNIIGRGAKLIGNFPEAFPMSWQVRGGNVITFADKETFLDMATTTFNDWAQAAATRAGYLKAMIKAGQPVDIIAMADPAIAPKDLTPELGWPDTQIDVSRVK